MKRCAALFALVFAAACGDTVTQPDVATDDLLVTSFAKVEKISICHYDEDTGQYFSKTIPASAWDDHEAHGDGVPGGDVPDEDMPGYTFDANCGLVPPPVGVTQCLQEQIDRYNQVFPVTPWDFDDFAPWTVATDISQSFVIVGNFFAVALVTDLGAAGTYCYISDAVGNIYSGTVPPPSQFDATRAYLLSLTQ